MLLWLNNLGFAGGGNPVLSPPKQKLYYSLHKNKYEIHVDVGIVNIIGSEVSSTRQSVDSFKTGFKKLYGPVLRDKASFTTTPVIGSATSLNLLHLIDTIGLRNIVLENELQLPSAILTDTINVKKRGYNLIDLLAIIDT